VTDHKGRNWFKKLFPKWKYTKMHKSRIVLCLSFFLFCFCVTTWAQEQSPQRIITEKLLSTNDLLTNAGITPSPDNKRIALVSYGTDGSYISIDGKKAKRYNSIVESTFSPDSKRFAYAVSEKVKEHMKASVVVDGIQGKQYDSAGGLIFSPNSKRFAYRARLNNKSFVVVDGVEGKKYDVIWGAISLKFSSDSKKISYFASTGNKLFLITDGKVEKQFEFNNMESNDFGFSPDNQHFTYVVKENEKEIAVIDGKKGKQYDEIDSYKNTPVFLFSPDSKRIAYLARLDDNKQFVVIDGQEGKQYDGIEMMSMNFSPDSKRFSYVARLGKLNLSVNLAVIDGIEGKRYDGIDVTDGKPPYYNSPVFSPDSKRIAYIALSGGKEFVVIDGVEGKRYDHIQGCSLVFSPDSKSIAYFAELNSSRLLIINGKENEVHHGLPSDVSPIFSPDSKRVAYIAELCEQVAECKRFVIVDGTEGKKYDSIESHIVFDSPGTLRYIAVSGKNIYSVEERIN